MEHKNVYIMHKYSILNITYKFSTKHNDMESLNSSNEKRSISLRTSRTST